MFVLSAFAAGCLAELDQGARAPHAGQTLPSRLRVAVCEAVVAAAQNGVRPSSLDVELPVDGTHASVALRFDGAQLPQAQQCADVVPAAAMLPAWPTPSGPSSMSVSPTAPANTPPPVGAPGPVMPTYPSQPIDPLNTRR